MYLLWSFVCNTLQQGDTQEADKRGIAKLKESRVILCKLWVGVSDAREGSKNSTVTQRKLYMLGIRHKRGIEVLQS